MDEKWFWFYLKYFKIYYLFVEKVIDWFVDRDIDSFLKLLIGWFINLFYFLINECMNRCTSEDRVIDLI